eukprot:TRINITY_DN403_c0_g1_i1.p1 TRINITY_DN403_c0_g1~~TRINITY_DN403_c0_g1_i1.p1  ORF type:complete len:492 (-),score=158.80 TRINITY_DN403_c0_g1_i1:87-1562(-)
MIKAKALYAYTAQQSNCLSMNEGDILNIIDKPNQDWWGAELNGKRGLVPSAYLEVIESTSSSSPTTTSTSNTNNTIPTQPPTSITNPNFLSNSPTPNRSSVSAFPGIRVKVDNNVPEEGGSTSSEGGVLIHEGWLVKEGGIHKNWKKRWFVLKDGAITYFDSKNSDKKLGTVPLKRSKFYHIEDYQGKKYCFAIQLDVRYQEGRIYRFCANTEGEMNKWIEECTKVGNDYEKSSESKIVFKYREESISYNDNSFYTGIVKISAPKFLRSGNGVMTYSNGEKYIGNWVDDKEDGEGSYHYTNGDVYTGNYTDGMKNGAGVLSKSDGEKQQMNYYFGLLINSFEGTYLAQLFDGGISIYENYWLPLAKIGDTKTINKEAWIQIQPFSNLIASASPYVWKKWRDSLFGTKDWILSKSAYFTQGNFSLDESVRPSKWVGEDKKPDFWVVLREHKFSLPQKNIFVKFTVDNRNTNNRCLLDFMYEDLDEKSDPRKK